MPIFRTPLMNKPQDDKAAQDQEAISRAIEAIKNNANKQATSNSQNGAQPSPGFGPQNMPQAPSPTPNQNLPSPDSEQTMQPDATNLNNALQGKTRNKQLDDLGLGFPQK